MGCGLRQRQGIAHADLRVKSQQLKERRNMSADVHEKSMR